MREFQPGDIVTFTEDCFLNGSWKHKRNTIFRVDKSETGNLACITLDGRTSIWVDADSMRFVDDFYNQNEDYLFDYIEGLV